MKFSTANQILLSALLCCIVVCNGCQKTTVLETSVQSSDSTDNRSSESNQTKEATNGTETLVVTNMQDAPLEEEKSKYMRQITSLFENAKKSGETSASNTKEFMSDLFSATKDKTVTITNDTSEMLSKLFQSAKEAGNTSAENSQAWLKEEWAKMGTWEYKYVELAGDPQSSLDTLGKERWELVAVDSSPKGERMFIFKRPVTSSLEKIPSKELIKLIPVLIGL